MHFPRRATQDPKNGALYHPPPIFTNVFAFRESDACDRRFTNAGARAPLAACACGAHTANPTMPTSPRDAQTDPGRTRKRWTSGPWWAMCMLEERKADNNPRTRKGTPDIERRGMTLPPEWRPPLDTLSAFESLIAEVGSTGPGACCPWRQPHDAQCPQNAEQLLHLCQIPDTSSPGHLATRPLHRPHKAATASSHFESVLPASMLSPPTAPSVAHLKPVLRSPMASAHGMLICRVSSHPVMHLLQA